MELGSGPTSLLKSSCSVFSLLQVVKEARKFQPSASLASSSLSARTSQDSSGKAPRLVGIVSVNLFSETSRSKRPDALPNDAGIGP